MGDQMEAVESKEEDLTMNTGGSADSGEPEVDIGGGGDSVLVAENDPCSPLDLLVDHTWFHVVSYLDDSPGDLMNLAQTCTYFQDLVETPKPQGFGAGHGACRLEEVFPLLYKWLGRKDILASRLVCHRVGNTVDKIVQSWPKISPHRNLGLFPRLIPPFYHKSERRMSFDWTHFRFYFNRLPKVVLASAGRLENFQDYLESQRSIRTRRGVGPRVVAGTVSLEVPLSGEPAQIFQSQAKFVQRSVELFRASRNEKIQSVCLQIVKGTPLMSVYEILRSVCGVAPQLQGLIIVSEFKNGVPRSEESERQLNIFIRGHQLPPAPNLEFLCLDFRITRPFLRHLAEAFGAHLRILSLDVVDPALTIQRPVQVPEYNFPVLELMCVLTSYICLPLLLSIKAPSLKVVHLMHLSGSGEANGRRKASPLVELIEAVNNFPSLVTLLLHVRQPIIDIRVDEDILREPHWVVPHQALKSLVIWTSTQLPTLRFFLNWLPYVEYISLDRERSVGIRDDPDLTLLEAGQLQESTIWRETPTLEMVRMKAYVTPYIHDDPNSSWYAICKRPVGT